METNQIKKFAIEARQVLLRGVSQRIAYWGFNADGEVISRPASVENGYVFKGELFDDRYFYGQWQKLSHEIEKRGIKTVAEEAAYTWFNRLVAIRILQKNKIITPVLAYEDEQSRVPIIVADARRGLFPEMSEQERLKLRSLLQDDSKETEQFAILIKAFCHSNPILNAVFGHIDDYTLLLLPSNILAEGGFVDMLNHTTYITDEDYKHSELIGWLYQFYISEKKDEVFKKNKYDADEIPAATQIFTPNWIVKYMVENTIGRIYLDNNEDSNLAENMPYLVEQSSDNYSSKLNVELEDMKMIDPACGSGHILAEAFDLFMQMYQENIYSRYDAIENILTRNIVGIDLDTRAKQLSQFSLLLKACQLDVSFADAHILPKVYDMPDFDKKLLPGGTLKDYLPHFFLGGSRQDIEQTSAALELMKNASTLGSIMIFDISSSTREDIEKAVKRIEVNHELAHYFILPFMKVILVLTNKYTAVAANPPYMGSGKMNAELSQYVKDNYPDSKVDLFSIFMEVAIDLLQSKGKYGMINMQSWMFLSSFEKLRKKVIEETHIDSMLHLGHHTFDELSGEVVQNTAFVISKIEPLTSGTYFRLVDGKDCAEKERLFLDTRPSFLANEDIVSVKQGNKIYYSNVSQKDFEKIQECPFAYWISSFEVTQFQGRKLNEFAKPCKGIDTGENDYFLRIWFEINNRQIDKKNGIGKYVPYNKGGGFRKWYGFRDFILRWNGSDEELKERLSWKMKKPTLRNRKYWFKESFTWSSISSGAFSCRFSPKGALFDNGGSSMFSSNNLLIAGAFANSKVASRYFEFLAPSLNYQPGDVGNLAFADGIINERDQIENVAEDCISISAQDWDAHETSWDFQGNELIRFQQKCIANVVDKNVLDEDKHQKLIASGMLVNNNLVKDCVETYKKEWTRKFSQLHTNEEELNRQFINIYGLQDELSPDVPLDEITILQQNEIKIVDNEIVWNDAEIMKQFISYAIGCCMGRYRLDKPGLHIAYPNPTEEDIAPYTYQNNQFEIDDDGIIPIISSDLNNFSDNAETRIKDFIRIVFGEDSATENMNFIEKCLGKSIDSFMVKDFWKDHKKRYQNRPIYWMFRSKKGYFQVIAYMHRMTPITSARVRNNYLLPYIQYLEQTVATMSANNANLNTTERKRLKELNNALDDCMEYDTRLNDIARDLVQFDLDDGVVLNYAKFGNVLAKLK